jgi:hypothetical protein
VNSHTATIFPLAPRRIATSIAIAALLLTVLGALGGCRRQAEISANSDNKSAKAATTLANNDSKPAQQVRTAANDDIKFLLPGKMVYAVFTTKSRSLVIQANETVLRAAYAWEPGQEPKLLVQGKIYGITRLSDDSFAAWYSDHDDQTSVVTFDAHQLTSQPLGLPNFSGWGVCEGNDEVLVCLGNRPGIRPEDIDEMGFTAVLVVDLAERKTSWFDVGHRTDYRFDGARKLIYVSDQNARAPRRGVEIFNLKGESLGPSDESHLQATSRSGRFIESLHRDGQESWQIYELATKQQLFAFNCGGPDCKTGDHNDDYWNPVIDGQFAVVRDSGKAYGKGSTCDVYQTTPPHLVKSFPCDGLMVYDWSRDGKELITLEQQGGSFHRESVN